MTGAVSDDPGLVPKLRFPGFEGDWPQPLLRDIAAFSKGKGISKADIVFQGRTPCIRYGELYTYYGVKIDRIVSRTNCELKDLVLSDGNEVIIPASGEDPKDIATASVVLAAGIALGGDLNIIKSEFDGYFLASYLSGKKRVELAALAQGNSVVHLYPSQIGSIRIGAPTLPEQQKIADFLAAVDARLGGLRQKRDLLAAYKRGVMQQIFTQTLRFKQDDGSAFPDWEEKRLGDVAQVYQPETLSQTQLDKDGKYLVYGANGVIGRLHRFNHKNPQVTVTCRGNTCGTVSFTEPESWITGNSMVVNLDNSLLATKHFIFYALSNTDWKYLITGSGQPQITGEIKKHALQLPTLPEQEKIADFLSALDAKITALDSKITQTEAFKKGLLQQMFV